MPSACALGRKKSTLEDYESTLRVHLVPFFGRRTLEEIDIPLVEAFVYEELSAGRAPKSIRNYLGLLHSILDHGIKRGWCDTNPVALVEKPRALADPDIRFLTLAELEAVLAATPETPLGRVDRAIFLTAAMTGMRRGECRRPPLAGRRLGSPPDPRSAQFHARTVRNPQVAALKPRGPARGPPRGRTQGAPSSESDSRMTPTSSSPTQTTGGVLDPSKLRKRFLAAARRAGVRPVRFHDLRHTFGTQMAAAGAPLRAIQEWLGHADLRTTLIYADYALDPNQGALYAERAFGGQAGENTVLEEFS